MPGFTTRPEIRGTFGVVATTHWLASSVAMGVLEKGGNAFDAAVAAGFTLQVVEPHLCGPLGEAPVLVYSAKNRRAEMICGQGVAPQGATIAHYKSLGLDLIPGTGLLAATVPGAFDAWARLARDYGTMPLAELMEPALGYAENGYPLVGRIRDTIMTVAELFRREWTTSAAVYLPGGHPPTPGKLFRNPTLAATYRRVLAESEAGGGSREQRIERARDAWYKGFVAETIDRFCRTQQVLDSSGRRHGGVLTADDMARWQAPVEAPLTYDYRGYTVVKGGPWSQGPVMLQQLALLQGFDLDGLDPVGPEFVHIVTECAKLAYADREAWYGDPDFVDVPMATLLSREYNDIRRKLVGERASLDLRPGSPDGREPYVLVGGARRCRRRPGSANRPSARWAGIGEPTTSELGVVAGDTCHLDIIDRWGNMVSATPIGRLAAKLAGHPRTRLLSRHAAADRVARRAFGLRARARQAPAQHAVADPRAEGRRAVDGVRHPRRRRAGPVVDAAFPASCASRDEFAGGDRLPGIQQRPRAVVVLPARRQPRRSRRSKAASRTTPPAPSPSAATRCASAKPGPAAA